MESSEDPAITMDSSRLLQILCAPGFSTRVEADLGAGRGVSVRQMVEAVRSVTGRAVPTVDEPRRAGDPAVLIASSEAARGVLGWAPQFEDVRVILETAWDWRVRHPKGYEE